MHLVSCASPQEPLEAAPRTALLADLNEGERWEGFWASDVYFVRCTRQDGDVEWFQVADEDIAPPRASDARTPHRGRAPVPASQSRVAVVIARSPNGQRMLVGSGRRTSR